MENSQYFSPSADGSVPNADSQVQIGDAITEVEFSTFRNNFDNQPRQVKLPLPELVKRLLVHPEKATKIGPAFSPAIYPKGLTRKDVNVIAVSMLVLDIDDGTPYASIKSKLVGIKHLMYTSFRHSQELHKYRVVVFLDQPVPAADWPQVWMRANAFFDGHLDEKTSDPSRMYFLPAHPKGGLHCSEFQDGRLFTLADLPELPASAKALAPPSVSGGKRAQKHSEVIRKEEASKPHPAEALPVMVKRCAFMQYASAPENQPNLSEPEWRAMVSNAAMAEASDAFIHIASEHHPDC